MKVEELSVIADTRETTLEAESHISLALGALARLRSQLSRLEEENRSLRLEAIKRQTQFYTEREFAALLKVSVATIGRLRHAGKLEPLHVGSQIRYSSVHVENIQTIFGEGMKTRSGRLKSFRNR